MEQNKGYKQKVIGISAAHFIHDVYSAFLAPILPLLIEKLGISLSLAGLLDVVRRIPSLFNPLIGLIADKAGLKYMVILTPAITGILMSIVGLAPSYAILVIILFMAGLSGAFFHVPSPVLIKKFAANKTATGMSYYMFGGEIARTVGPLVITAAISWWGLEETYRLMPVAILASIILFVYLKDLNYVVQEKKEKRTARYKAAERKRYIPLFTGITGYLLSRAAMKASLTLYLVVYLVDKGSSLWFASAALSILQLAGAAGTFFSGYISDKISYKISLLVSAIFSPLLMFGFIYLDALMIPFLVAVGFFLFASTPVIMAIVQNQATERPAFFNSIYMTISFVLSSLMVLVVGIMGDNIGLEFTMKISTLVAFIAIPFVFIFPRNTMKSKN